MRREYVVYPQDMPIAISYVNIKNYPIHWHNSIEILYVLKGKINVTIDTDTYEIEENELEIVNIDESHRIFSDEFNKVLIFHIDPNFFEKYYNDIKNMFFYTNTSDKGAQEDERYNEFRTILSIILCEFTQKSNDYDEEVEKALVDLLFHLINNFHYLLYDNDEIKSNEAQLERYHRISKYIFNNYNNNITLQDIAKNEFLSTHYLSHEIKYATGYSFTDLINLTRVEESVKLLLDTDKTISEICEEVGFSHTRYYNKHFKAYYKSTPLQYRKKFKVDETSYENQKKIINLSLNDSLKELSSYLDDYERFNYENKINKLSIDLNNNLGSFTKSFKKILNAGDSFDLLIEDNKESVEELQEEIGFKYVRLSNVFSQDMGVFPGAKFINWTRAYDIFEYVETLNLIPLIVISNVGFSDYQFLDALTSFLEYFNEVETLKFSSYKFQFSSDISEDLANDIRIILEDNENLEILNNNYKHSNDTNLIYDTAYMLPFIIHNALNSSKNIEFIKAFDVLDRQIDLTNEVFFGYPGVINDKGIKKPSYYAYYLLNKLGDTLIAKDYGYIVTKNSDEYQILLYNYNEDIDKLMDFKKYAKFRGTKNILDKKLSVNILNSDSNIIMTKYNINEKIGSSYNYWVSMGRPKRLKKEEKEILHKASFPNIDFKYFKKSIVLNLQISLSRYGAQLIILKKI